MANITNQEWEKILSEYSDVHILQTTEWGELKSKFGWKVLRIANSNAGAQILFKHLPFGLTWAYLPKGPFGYNWEELWPKVQKECLERKAVFLKIEPDLWLNDQEKNQSRDFPQGCLISSHSIQPSRTIVIDLQPSEDEMLSNMKQKTRYNIRLAERKGVMVTRSNNVKRFHQLSIDTGKRDEFGIHSYEYYKIAFDLFNSVGKCELFLAEFNEILLAAAMVFINDKRAWYFYGASSNEYRNMMGSYLVQWEAIRWAKHYGCLEYDLWGVPDYEIDELEAQFTTRNDGLWSVYRFKRGFGGSLCKSLSPIDMVFKPFLYNFYRLWMKIRKS
jgi:peptidoglycan pentaglycine glycine transferase (the first glycine)